MRNEDLIKKFANIAREYNRKERERLSDFGIGRKIRRCYRQLSEKEIGVGWASWNCYTFNREWVCSVHRWHPVSRRTKEDWVVRLTFLGLYVEWLPSEFYVDSCENGADNIVPKFPKFPNLIEKTWMLEDAEFEIAPEDSEFDIWVRTKDGGKHKFMARDAIQLSQIGGKGPDRLRDWIVREWCFKEYVEKPNKLGKMSYHSQPDDGIGDNGKTSKSTQIH